MLLVDREESNGGRGQIADQTEFEDAIKLFVIESHYSDENWMNHVTQYKDIKITVVLEGKIIITDIDEQSN